MNTPKNRDDSTVEGIRTATATMHIAWVVMKKHPTFDPVHWVCALSYDVINSFRIYDFFFIDPGNECVV